MNNILKERLVNRSDKDSFRFTLTCAVCGGVWQSTPLSFSGYTYAQAQQAAYMEAVERFAACKLCGDPACENCYITIGEMTVCGTCAKKMGL